MKVYYMKYRKIKNIEYNHIGEKKSFSSKTSLKNFPV